MKKRTPPHIERTDDHRYFILSDGDRFEALSTTRTIIEAGLVDDEFFTDAGRIRGKMVHALVERVACDTLDKPIDADALGYLVGLRKFLDKEAPTIHGAEVILGNLARLYAGTVDLDVTMSRARTTIDVKTGEPEPWHGVQLAAYAYLADGPKWLSRLRLGLYLRPTGGYRLKEYDDPEDLAQFFRGLETLHWRIQRGTYDRPYGRKPSIRVGTGIGTGHDEYPAIDHDIGSGRIDLDGDSPF